MIPLTPCVTCELLEEGLRCAAFPQGIPQVIVSGENQHREPLPQQTNAVVFTPHRPVTGEQEPSRDERPLPPETKRPVFTPIEKTTIVTLEDLFDDSVEHKAPTRMFRVVKVDLYDMSKATGSAILAGDYGSLEKAVDVARERVSGGYVCYVYDDQGALRFDTGSR